MENQNNFLDFLAYMKFQELPKEVKANNKIKVDAVIPRYDLVLMAGYWGGLNGLKTKKGLAYLNLIRNDSTQVINGAQWRLQTKDSCNFSSLFVITQKLDNCFVGYGNPLRKETFSIKQKPNPFYEYKNDGLLFVISEDWKQIEVLIIKDGFFTIQGNAEALANGCFNEALETMRATAKEFYQY